MTAIYEGPGMAGQVEASCYFVGTPMQSCLYKPFKPGTHRHAVPKALESHRE